MSLSLFSNIITLHCYQLQRIVIYATDPDMQEIKLNDTGGEHLLKATLGLTSVKFSNYHINFQNFIVLIMQILDFENRKHTEF